MKIAVLVPSDEYRNYAGARIRYGRLRPSLSQIGSSLELVDVATFSPHRADCDALLISKCHDARSLLAAAIVSGRGKLVGVDLFDDYFSQLSDSRLASFRNWLEQLIPLCHFALCSTGRMAKVAQTYCNDLPIHVLNDPAVPDTLSNLPEILASKLDRVVDEQKIRLCWFGIGDNPYFKVGLSDLAAYGGTLAKLHGSGLAIELNVLTNARALDAKGLGQIGRLPVRTTIHEWTEDRERDQLAEAFACFLPVNSQAFSTAKSLNRATTALMAGCQIIWAGYPLYKPLDRYLYCDPLEFIADTKRRRMRVSASEVDDLRALIDTLASPAGQALAFTNFLKELPSPASDAGRTVVLIHGHEVNSGAHQLVHAVNGYSVASPYCADELGFDVMFRRERGRLAMLVSDGAASRIRPELRSRSKPEKRTSDRKYREVPDEELDQLDRPSPSSIGEVEAVALQMTTYRETFEQMRARMERAFGPCQFLLSEVSQIPFVSTLATRP